MKSLNELASSGGQGHCHRRADARPGKKLRFQEGTAKARSVRKQPFERFKSMKC
jgi:hypothetical protein